MRPRTPLFSPWKYYDHPDSASLKRGAAIVLVAGLATGIQAWWFANAAFSRIDIPARATSRVQSMLVGQLVGTLVAVFVGWLILAAVLHVFLWFSQAERGYGSTLAVVWESQVVAIALLPLTVIILFLFLDKIPSNLGAAADMARGGRLAASPLLAIATFVSTIWIAIIQGAGLARIHDVAEDRTYVLAIGVGLVVYLLNFV